MRKPNRQKICPSCKNIFLYYGSKNNERKYCSRKCLGLSNLGKRKYNFKCGFCKKQIYTSDNRIRFCNRKCYNAWQKTNPNSGMFKSREDKIKKDRYYYNLHMWVGKNKPKPELCEECNKIHPKECHNIDKQYSKNLETWKWLCRKCHFEIHKR